MLEENQIHEERLEVEQIHTVQVAGEHRPEIARSSPGIDGEVRIEASDDLLAGTDEVEEEQDRQHDSNKGTRHVTD
jgi:hypothetical protein